MTAKKLPTPPVIDLGNRVQVMSDVGGKVVWKTVGTYMGGRHKAVTILRAAGEPCGWINDGMGREFVSAAEVAAGR